MATIVGRDNNIIQLLTVFEVALKPSEGDALAIDQLPVVIGTRIRGAGVWVQSTYRRKLIDTFTVTLCIPDKIPGRHTHFRLCCLVYLVFHPYKARANGTFIDAQDEERGNNLDRRR